MASFLSTFTFKVDRKGRLSVPASYRQILARNEARRFIAVALPSEPAIRCCGMEILDQVCADRNPMAIFERGQPDQALDLAAEMQELGLDDEGRMILPKPLADHAQIVDHATFVGRINYFEIWEPARYHAHRAQRLELMRQQPPAVGGGML